MKTEIEWQEAADERNDRLQELLTDWRCHNSGQDYPSPKSCANYNCSSKHPCLHCLKCSDCCTGTLNHSSNHPNEKKKRKTRIVLSITQINEIRTAFAKGGAGNRIVDLARMYRVSAGQIKTAITSALPKI